MVRYSVIIPTFNRCHTLARAIDSVLLQNHKHVEIIVIDDGSTDETARMLSQKYPQVKYYGQKNQGPAAARNLGIELAQGEYIAFLDSDDCWLEDKISKEMQIFQHYPQADVIAGNGKTYVQGQLKSSDTFLQRDIRFKRHQPRFFDWSMDIMRFGPTCLTSGLCFQRNVFTSFEFRPFDEALRFDEDWDFEFRLFNQFRVLLYPDIICTRYIEDDGTRHFYSPSGVEKNFKEQHNIWSQQQSIIARYLRINDWDETVQSRFKARHQQLNENVLSLQNTLSD